MVGLEQGGGSVAVEEVSMVTLGWRELRSRDGDIQGGRGDSGTGRDPTDRRSLSTAV